MMPPRAVRTLMLGVVAAHLAVAPLSAEQSATPSKSERARSGESKIAGARAGERTKPIRSKLPRGFVRLARIAPGIIEEVRYLTAQNFTGRRVPGYLANTCILARPVARALARVQQAVSKQGFLIKVYDCYRPVRAVRAFVRWAKGRSGNRSTKFYYPRIARSQIIPLGYVAEHSSHSRGTAVDLTLVRATPKPVDAGISTTKSNSSGSCISPKQSRKPDISIDMGTSWDCFDVKSHTHHDAISSIAKANRRVLLRAMQAEGFRNYKREWWHFSRRSKGYERAHNFDVD